MRLLWKLLRSHLSAFQLCGFVVADLLGMAILLFGVQFYADLAPFFDRPDSFMQRDFVVLSKKVSTVGSLVNKSGATFDSAEIEALSRQPFAQAVGAFTPCRYGVSAYISVLGESIDLSTQLFFEAVPDKFLDIQPEQWKFDGVTDNEVPIILPKNYLDLYNFGFAQSRSLPQLSSGVMGMLRLDLTLSGRGQQRQMKGRVVGFSSRLNTILVPESFARWSNGIFAESDAEGRPSRLIVETDDASDSRMAEYIQHHGYETESGQLDRSKTTYLLRMITGVVVSVGGVIVALSLFILVLSVGLLMQRNSEKLRNLMLIGYSASRVSAPYQLLAGVVLVGSWVLATAAVCVVRGLYLPLFGTLFPGYESGSLAAMLGVGGAVCVVLAVLNVWIIRGKVGRLRRD